jgi:arylsulfatase A
MTKHVLLAVVMIGMVGRLAAGKAPPNFVVLFADDLGYGDLACYGHPTIRTPELDRMAAEGVRLTQFYSAASVCTPSRAALLTGRLPIRSGMCHDKNRVLFPNSAGGLPDDELTVAEALKKKGYATACIGKWHLGHLPQYLPTRHGFDYYFGLPYSNDMNVASRGDPPVPLMRGEAIIEQPVVQETLTARYTEEAIRFVKENRSRPFFLYLPYTFPHVPLYASSRFKGTSPRGLYGDVVEEIDWSVGQVLQALRTLGLSKNTLVLFSSDNGPWLTKKGEGGTAGLLRDGKGSTWEGGMREPCIAWWPGRIKGGRVTQELASTLDVFPTLLSLAEAAPPQDRIIDGVDITLLLTGTGRSPRQVMFYYRGTKLMAIRKGPWKAHFITQPAYGSDKVETHDPPLLFHLEHDPSEKDDVAGDHPEVIADILQERERHQAQLKPAESQLEAKLDAK